MRSVLTAFLTTGRAARSCRATTAYFDTITVTVTY